MYCLSCGTSLPEEARFCFKCGKLTSKGNGEPGEQGHTPTFIFASSLSDPYSPRPSTSYGPPPPEGGTQYPYAPLAPPPPHYRRFWPGLLKGFFIGMFVTLLLSGGLGALLLLKQGANSLAATPQPSARTTSQTAITTAIPQASAVAQTANPLYRADWSSGLNGWYEFPGFQDWKVSGGMLRDDGTNSGSAAPGIEASYEVTYTSDYAVETEMQTGQAGQAGQPCFDITTIRANDHWYGYKAVICKGKVAISKVNSPPKSVALAIMVFDPGTSWHTYRLEAKGITLRLLIDGYQVLQAHDNTYQSGGKLGLNSFQTQLNIRSYKVFTI